MELVYLWVEDYKNIKKQGFNFSPKFYCEYNDIKKELTINENDDYIPNFFGENINVTAIVGKNGSGKSSLFEVMLYKYTKITIFLLKNKKLLVSYIDNTFNVNTSHDYILQKKKEKDSFSPLYYSLDKIEDNNNINIINNIPINFLIFKNYEKINNLPSKMYLFKAEFFMYELSPYLQEQWFDEDSERDFLKNELPFLGYGNEWEFIFDSILNEYNKPNKYVIYLLSCLGSLSDNIQYIIDNDFANIGKDYVLKYEKIQLLLKSLNITYLDYALFQQLIDNQNKKLKISEFNNKLGFNSIELLQKLVEFEDIKFFSKDQIKFSSLSHGEKTIYKILLSILNYTSDTSLMKSKYILLDEPNNLFHPQWQKKFLLELINTFQLYPDSLYFIFTTHSPFLLSDIPKQHIIFLDKDKNGNCKVVDGTKQTFGQNIHTLLKDNFFMEGSLMGEFAKGKIEDVINFLQEKETTIKSHKEAKQIIDIIGEPVLQMRLERMLDNYKLRKNIETEEDIEKQIKALQVKLQKKKNG